MVIHKLENPRRKLLSVMIAALSFGGSVLPASAQQESSQLEEITVTGTRIRQTDNMVTPVPVTAVNRDELMNFEPGGTVAEQLDVLPQFYRTVTAQRAPGNMMTGTGGGSYLDMRSLGTNRTLVLLDGQRMMPADKRGSPNVDTFPTALVRNVEVVTGGASAAYGADALGGVTNFVLDREFQGLDVEIGAGRQEMGGAGRWNMSIAGGTQIGERWNVIGSIEARQIDEVWIPNEEVPEEWHQGWGYVTNPAWREWREANPGADRTDTPVPERLTLPWVGDSRGNATGIIRARNSASDFAPLIPFQYNEMTFLNDGSGVRPFNQGDVYAPAIGGNTTRTFSGGPEAEVHNRTRDFGPSGNKVEGQSAFLAGQYQFNDNVSGFVQGMWGRSHSSRIDRHGDQYLSGGQHATVFRDNAFLPEEIGLAMDEAGIDSFQLHKHGGFLGDNNAGAGSRHQSDFTTWSVSAGIDALFSNGWDLRVSVQNGESERLSRINDKIRSDRGFLAADAVIDPDTGGVVCRVQLFNPTEEELIASMEGSDRMSSRGGPLLAPIGLDNTVQDCVPYNIMGAGNMSEEAMNYMSTPMTGKTNVEQTFFEALLRGEAFEGWAGPISFATGLTWREQSFKDGAFPVEIDALGPPQNRPELGIQGISIRYYDSLPTLWQFTNLPTNSGSYDVSEIFGEVNVPVWAAASGSQRLDTNLSYRSSDYFSGRLESWKVGVDFQLTEDLRFRFTESRDAREPNFEEQFARGSGGVSLQDPNFGGDVFQISTVVGGDPSLRPEIARTTVAGLVYQPGWLPGFSISSDWYEINIQDAVGTLGAQRIVNECFAGATRLCNQIERGADGTIQIVADTFLNVDAAKVEGIDFEVGYQIEPNFFSSQNETLGLRVLGGYVKERSDTPLGGMPQDIAGTLEMPDLTGVATLSYNVGAIGVQMQQRYIAGSIRNVNWVEGIDVDNNSVSSGNYTNLRVSYNGEESFMSGVGWSVALNVTNLFDRAPPRVPNSSYNGGSQTTDTFFDTFGRRYFLSLNMEF